MLELSATKNHLDLVGTPGFCFTVELSALKQLRGGCATSKGNGSVLVGEEQEAFGQCSALNYSAQFTFCSISEPF